MLLLVLLLAGVCEARSLDLSEQRDAIASSLGARSGWPRPLLLLPLSNEVGPAARSVEFYHSGQRLDHGVSLRRDVDSFGYRRYTLLFSALSNREASFEIRARVRKPEKRLGDTHSRRTLALGFAVPWRQYGFELEAVDDGTLGRALLGSVRWTDDSDRFGCGVTVPIAAPRGLAGAVIVQLVYRFSTPPQPVRTGWF